MSTISTTRDPARLTDDADPFRYGWRHVKVIGPDGEEMLDQVPLTLEDVLFPEVGDFIVQSDAHDNDLTYLKEVFKSRLADDPRSVVVSDCRVDWGLPGVRPLGPDIAVFHDVEQYRLWSTLEVVPEHVRPALVVEVTSPRTRSNDVGIKVDFYHRARVPMYVIADVTDESDADRRIELLAYRYTPRRYERIEPDGRGWIWLPAVRVWLGLAPERRVGYLRLATFDPDTGEEIGDYTAVAQALAAEQRALAESEARAAVSDARAAESEARARELEAQLAAEAQARAALEARLRELEGRLRQGD